MFAVGSGIGRKTAFAENYEREQIIENYAKRVETLGKFPGTHTLGEEFQIRKTIVKVVDDSERTAE